MTTQPFTLPTEWFEVFSPFFKDNSQLWNQASLTLDNLYKKGLSLEEILKHCHTKNPNDILNAWFQINLTSLLTSLDSNKITIALWLHEHCDLYNQQQSYLVEEIEKDPRYQCIILQNLNPLSSKDLDLHPSFRQKNALFIPDENILQSLDFIEVIIALDFACSRMVKLPPKAIRINQPHGMDIKFNYSIEFYGAGLMFDALLLPSLAQELYPTNYNNRYINVFGPDQIDHSSHQLTCFPIGSPKLDRFIQEAQLMRSSNPQDIIYNISYWGLESDYVKQNIYTICKALLDTFPKHKIIFRPYPGESEEVLSHLKELPQRENFYLSTSISYLEDYRNGAVLLYHRGSSADNFALATGAPAIKLTGNAPEATGDVSETSTGYLTHHLQDLLALIHHHFKNPQEKSQRIINYREQILPHAGQGISFLLNQIPLLLEKATIPGTLQIPLFSSDCAEGEIGRVQSATIMEQNRFRIPLLQAQQADLEPENALYQFFAARSIMEHIYPSEKTPLAWLHALEYTVQMFKAQKHCPMPSQQWKIAENWLAKEFAERFIAQTALAVKYYSTLQMKQFHEAISQLPLEVFDQDGVPDLMRKRR